MSPSPNHVDRRTLLGALCGAVALAGCIGDETDDTGDETDDTGNELDDPDDTDDSSDDGEEVEALDEPTEFPQDEPCVVCEMIAEEYPEWNAQLVTAGGTRVYFCSSGCLLAYYVDPEHFDGEDELVENVWVTAYDTGELIDGRESYYVRVEDSDHVDDIMMMNPTPFSAREDAEAFIDELNDEFDAGYNHDADVITFDEFDMELAMHYRARFLGDDHGDHDHGDDHGDHDHGDDH